MPDPTYQGVCKMYPTWESIFAHPNPWVKRQDNPKLRPHPPGPAYPLPGSGPRMSAPPRSNRQTPEGRPSGTLQPLGREAPVRVGEPEPGEGIKTKSARKIGIKIIIRAQPPLRLNADGGPPGMAQHHTVKTRVSRPRSPGCPQSCGPTGKTRTPALQASDPDHLQACYPLPPDPEQGRDFRRRTIRRGHPGGGHPRRGPHHLRDG